jgi:colicin import membrane protein
MPRKLKIYQMSLGFFDLAVAAPSMKAALEAWGAGSNLFHRSAAKQTEDPDVVAATLSKPGVVLKRPAGSSGRFAEHSELPSMDDEEVHRGRSKRSRTSSQPTTPTVRENDAREAALQFEREQERRDVERQREQAARAKEQAKRSKAVAKAEAVLQKAEREHDEKVNGLRTQRDAIEERLHAENDQWEKRKNRLEAALRKARY